MTSPFEVLGLPVRFAIEPSALEARWKELSKAFHPDRHVQAAPAERRAALGRAVAVNEAYRALRDDLSRAQTILALRDPDGAHEPADPALLMEVMELREGLADRKSAGDRAGIEAMAVQVRSDAARTASELSVALDEREDLAVARVALGRLRYLRRFLDEVELALEP